MLNDGMFKGNQILKKQTIDLFKQPYTNNLNESRTMGGWYYGDLTTSAIHPSRETSIVKVRKSFHEQILDYIDHNS